MKKICLLFIVLIILVFPVAVISQEGEVIERAEFNNSYSFIPEDDACGTALLAGADSFEDVVYAGLFSLSDSIEVSEFNLAPTAMTKKFWNLLNTNPDLYFVDRNISYTHDGTRVVSIAPNYSVTDKTEINSTIEQIHSAADEYMSLITPEMTDIEKLLTLHTKMVAECEYDLTYQKRTAKNIFVDKTAVCQGYSEAFAYLVGELGIPVGFVESEAMNHVWNVVKLDGNWYHIDVTYDDPEFPNNPGIYAHLNYSCFLKSNAGIATEAASSHSGFAPVQGADDTSFDNAFWNNVISPIVVLANNWYFLENGQIIRYNSLTKGSDVLHSLNDRWPAHIEGSYWTDKYSGIGYYDGRLFFNTPSEIKSIDLDGGNASTVYSLNDPSKSIYGLYVENGVAGFSTGKLDLNNTIIEKNSLSLTKNPDYKQFYIIDNYLKNGKKHIHYINNTDTMDGIIYIAAHADDRLKDIDLEFLSGGFTGVASFESFPNGKVYVWDHSLSPITAMN